MKKFLCTLICIFCLFNQLKVSALSVSAKAAAVIDAISGKMLYSKNSDLRLPMASTTKIMTALILCESTDLERQITVTGAMVNVEGSSMGLRVGMKITLRDLLYGMMLSSGNDAANATAIALGGSIKGFVEMMNQKAQLLGLKDTHFDTPSGLDGDTHYTTAFDLAMLTRYALTNREFASACSKRSVTLSYGGKKTVLTNHNRLLSMYDGALGVKTGFTKKSGRCLVSAAKKDGALIIAVTLNDGNDWQDHINMLKFGFSQLDENLTEYGKKKYTVAVLSGEKDSIEVYSDEIAFRTLKGEKITREEFIYPYLYAPIKKGEVIGYIEYKNGEFTVAKQTLYANEDIKAKVKSQSFKRVYDIFTLLLDYV